LNRLNRLNELDKLPAPRPSRPTDAQEIFACSLRRTTNDVRGSQGKKHDFRESEVQKPGIFTSFRRKEKD
jgi:hypothetical protein